MPDEVSAKILKWVKRFDELSGKETNWWLLISISGISSTKEMNTSTRTNFSKVVMWERRRQQSIIA